MSDRLSFVAMRLKIGIESETLASMANAFSCYGVATIVQQIH